MRRLPPLGGIPAAKGTHIMQIGLFNLLSKRDPDKPTREVYGDMRDQVRLAEDAGFDVAWFTEHHFSNYCLSPSPLTMATWMAGQTSRIKLGTAVVVTPLYEPLRMLEDIAVLDQLSEGRLVLGLGSGYQRHEFHKFGLELAEARDRFLESLDLIENFFRSDSIAYEGRYLKIPETYCSVRPLQSMPEIFVAGLLHDAQTQQRMARSGYTALNSAGGLPTKAVLANRAIVEGAHRAAGKDVRNMPFAIQQFVHITDRREEAREAAEHMRFIRRVVAAMRGGYVRLDGAWLREQPAQGEPSLEEIMSTTYIGSAGEVAERMIEQTEALRPTHLSCFMAIGGLSGNRVMRTIERFAAQVLPQVAGHFGGLDRIGTGTTQVASAAT